MPISVPTAYVIAQDFYYKWYLCKFPFPLQKNGNLPVAAFYAQVLKLYNNYKDYQNNLTAKLLNSLKNVYSNNCLKIPQTYHRASCTITRRQEVRMLPIATRFIAAFIVRLSLKKIKAEF